MRVAENMTYQALVGDMMRTQGVVVRLQQQLASGRKVDKPSDDPGVYSTICRLHSDLSAIRQFTRNTEDLETGLLFTDRAIQQATNILSRAQEIAVRGADATVSAVEREAMGREVDQLLDGLVAVANSSDGGRYIFAGLRTDKQPFDASDTDGDGLTDSVTYSGGTGVRNVEVAPGVYVPANLPGANPGGSQAAFVTSDVDLFSSIIQLRDRLLNGDNLSEGQTLTADAGTDILTATGPIRTGSQVVLRSEGTLPGGLTPGTTYYAISVAGGIQLAATLDDARNGVAIDLTDAGVGTHSLEQTVATELDRCLEHTVAQLSTVGAREAHVRLILGTQTEREDGTLSHLAQLEDADIAKTVAELTRTQAAYEATLRATAMVLNRRSLTEWI
jgi:flagellar hook-associated protein 3 FlgL